ncbi:MAG: hypothetical protein ABI577_12150 [bacterium]
MLLFSAVIGANFAACGNDAGNDEGFVRGLCEASSALRAGIQQAGKDGATSTEPGKAVDLMVAPVDAFVKSFGDLNPPKDLNDWHSDATKQLKQTADTFRAEKKLTVLASFNDSPVPDPPAAAKARLQTVATGVSECNGVAFLKP